MKRMWTRALLLGAAGLAGGSVVGCAQERPPINRVQADALAKSFFVGAKLNDASDDPEFYMRGTVVDVGYGAAQDGLFTSTYAQPVSRIRWEITDGLLNARLAYERIQGTDSKGNKFDGYQKKVSNDGQIVASYKISSHFDIRRSYNPTTGEEQNVVEENTSDRPWYDREYFRVDWSSNLVTNAYDFDTLSMMGIFGGIEYEPLSYTVLDPADPDAPHFDAEQGYFDVTNKAYATPAVIDLSSLGWGIDSFPACFLPGEFAGGTNPYGNCNPTEITIRQSFRKIVDTDYEPFAVDGIRFQSFGIFTTDYHGYDRDYGMVDDKWWRFASRYNIWKRSHFYADSDKMTGAIQCDSRATTVEATQDPLADPNRDLDGNGTADECEAAGSGSQCDLFKGKCTLPYRNREAVAIPWYINGGSTTEIENYKAQLAEATDEATKRDLEAKIAAAQQKGEDYFEATNWAVEEWDIAMKTAIQVGRLIECKRTGGTDCDVQFPMWKGQQDDNDEAVEISRVLNACRRATGWDNEQCNVDAKNAAAKLAADRGNAADPSTLAIGDVVTMPTVIALCHNPVIPGDHPVCGKEGLSPRLGDLRYNTVLNIDKPQSPSAWGIMVDADDPISGEKVAASINVWTHITDIASVGLVDLIRYMNGELSTADITDGKYVRDWARAQEVGSGASGAGPTLTKEQVDERLAAAAQMDVKQFAKALKVSPSVAANIRRDVKQRMGDVAIDSSVVSAAQLAAQTRMSRARGSELESELINQPMLQLAGIKSTVPVQGAIAAAASPLALNNPKIRMQMRQMRENALAARGACILNEAPEASALTGIADEMKRKFPIVPGETGLDKQTRYERMQSYLRRRYHYAVIAHEMGHSIGLRHNFVSTYASLFFRPQYWQLRTGNGTVTDECKTSTSDGSTCTGPRYFDPVTPEESSQMIWGFMQSTVMDYPGDVSQDMIGLGAYDFAAARFFYGDNVSVYTDETYKAGTNIGVGVALATDTFGGLSGITYGTKSADFHYSQLQKNYNLIKDCYSVTPVQPANWRTDVDGEWSPLIDGKVVTVTEKGGAVTTKKCRQQPVDYVAWRDLHMPDPKADLDNGFYRGGPNVDPQGRLRVPYAFATDHWADTGNVSVFRHDNGADPYEQTMFMITTQENRHIFDNFRRKRSTFNVRAAADRSFGRYNEKMLGIAGGIGFYRTIYEDIGTSQGYAFDTLWPLILDGNLRNNIIGASMAFDHFTKQLSRPQPGIHYYRTRAFKDVVLHSNEDSDDYGVDTGTTSKQMVVIPNGATGYFRDVGFGGHPLENALTEDNGDFDSEYTLYAGSYYDKINTAILLSESEDRFISQSRRDFYDARFRAVGMADVFPDGYRRVIANALVGDRAIMAPRLQANPSASGNFPEPIPVLDTAADPAKDPLAKQYPARPLGWTSWWPTSGPEVCFPTDGKNICNDFLGDLQANPDTSIDANHMALVDPQIGYEVQKFMIAWTLAHIPANQKTKWVDMMRIYTLDAGVPEFQERVEWQDPQSGRTYYARTYGMECLFGAGTDKASCESSSRNAKWVQKGIGARVLEWANYLTGQGYRLEGYCDAQNPCLGGGTCDTAANSPTVNTCLGETTTYPATANYPVGFDSHGRAHFMTFGDGTPVVKADAAVKDVTSSGALKTITGCFPDPANNNAPNGCTPLTVYKNHFAYELVGYKSVPDFLRAAAYMFWDTHVLGEYP
jgi:hypothetical protein